MNRSDAAESTRNPYRGVIILLLAATLAGAVGAVVAGMGIGNPVLYAVAITLGLATGVLTGVLTATIVRARPQENEAETVSPAAAEETKLSGEGASQPECTPIPLEDAAAPPEDAPTPVDNATAPPESSPVQPESTVRAKAMPQWAEVLLRGSVKSGLRQSGAQLGEWVRYRGPVGVVRISTAILGALAILDLVWRGLPMNAVSGIAVYIEIAIALAAAGLVAVACRYLAGLETGLLPESTGLLRGARIVAWTLALSALSAVAGHFSQWAILQVLFFAILAINVAICYGLFRANPEAYEGGEIFPLNMRVLSVLGSRMNILASVQDAVEAQFGIDLRSTWALTVVRRGLEPLLIGLCLVGWLTTSLTVVEPEEQGLVERSGVPVAGPPLEPGLHLHWPWPADRVFRIPVKRVKTLTVGHEGEEEGGPENVLWAVEHAANEYTLLLGDGRDLVTIDAGVSYRISDARAWRYNCQNPADALKALSYRAVTRSIVGRTLADALSENVAVWTREMKTQIQKDADTLGLGVEVLGFTVGGMHPPVAVATDYEAVVSAELRKVTAVVNAQVFRNQTLPEAEAAALTGVNDVRSAAADALAKAAGEAWSFRALEAQFRASPEEYYFRRRLETLEKTLSSNSFTVVDTRIQRDGGELWMTP